MDFIQRGFTGKTNSWMYILSMLLVFLVIQLATIFLMIAAYFEVC